MKPILKKDLFCLFLAIVAFYATSFASPFSEKGTIFPHNSSFKNTMKSGCLTIKEKTLAAIQKAKEAIKSRKFLKIKRKTDKINQFVTKEIKIPGYENKKFVCQGITYLKLEKEHYALLSYFPKEKHTIRASQIIVVNLNDSKPVARFSLYYDDEKKYTGHAGGIAVAGDYVWVSSGYKLIAFSKDKIATFLKDDLSEKTAKDISPKSFMLPAKKLYVVKSFLVDSKASYVSFDGKQLWVGDFVKAKNKKFVGINHHANNSWNKNAWIAGYEVDDSGFPTAKEKYEFKDGKKIRTAFKPDRVLFCRELVQGMAVFNNHIALTTSYGAVNSKLAIYNSPLDGPSKEFTFSTVSGEVTVDAYGVNDEIWKHTYSIGAGAEDLEFDGEFLYVTFEGASPNYKTKWRLLNPLITIEKNFYLIDANAILEVLNDSAK